MSTLTGILAVSGVGLASVACTEAKWKCLISRCTCVLWVSSNKLSWSYYSLHHTSASLFSEVVMPYENNVLI